MPKFVRGVRCATNPPVLRKWLAGRYLYAIVVLALLLMTTACSQSFVNSSTQNDSALSNAPSPEATPTYDGSGQVTEPSIRDFPSGWRGFQYWLVVGPYPNSDASKENPSILVSNDGLFWEVPPGLTNPIDRPISGHLADSELFYDSSSDQLWAYYVSEDSGG